MMSAEMLARGFDESYYVRPGVYRPKCSQCEALVINGVACHETGCSHATHECAGCTEQILTQQRYCATCA